MTCLTGSPVFVAGERLDPPTHVLAQGQDGLPVIEPLVADRTGWAIACNPFGLEYFSEKPGSAGSADTRLPGRNPGSQWQSCPPGVQGAVCVRQPLPPGCLLRIWRTRRVFRAPTSIPIPAIT